ncbi:NAD(P)-binding domain-containing protein [Sphingosinicella sp. LHD-64]|uniref:NADPH-dependent F420 reductase n=1 Tax=Sphingosinicella sp. LHD-64 TaxID=3072139 RepID=UPI00280E82A3|nr:NAD(P)-binding domain-containing protein [Sphingosinicella sp. LHD-64]MDQ8755222.1 NAD(P)-binding domain-containing protein [Sphingosinicella sp. LHD-64]
MRIGILGTGMVGEALAGKCVERGHEVMMGSRSANSESVTRWAERSGGRAGAFAEAARFGEMVFSCLNGARALETLQVIDAEAVAGKIVIDVSNPLVPLAGSALPSLKYGVDNSLGEQVQAALPGARVVKALNTLNCQVMVDPGRVPGMHHLFIAGNDPDAKTEVAGFLEREFGWSADRIIDVGDITSARATELLMPLWMRLWQAAGHADFNWHIAGYRP